MKKPDLPRGFQQGKRLFPGLPLLAALWLAVGLSFANAQVGATFASLHTTGGDFTAVKVLSVSPSAITIRHAGGIAQIPLKNLPLELQSQFGYDPARVAEHEKKVAEETQAQVAAAKKRDQDAAQRAAQSPIDRAMSHFGTKPRINPVDLRPQFREILMAPKNQGPRPSCAVFAVVAALEFENAKVLGRVEKLSEEYAIWATQRVTGRTRNPSQRVEGEEAQQPDFPDFGFGLNEVLSGIRSYGIATEVELPYRPGIRMGRIPDPDSAVIGNARAHREVFMERIPGVTRDVAAANILHALNEGVPVVIGIPWPYPSPGGSEPLLDKPPKYFSGGHAIILVGYRNDSGLPDDIRFIFRNSWGSSWGEDGYGYVSLAYLRSFLVDALLVEVRPKSG